MNSEAPNWMRLDNAAKIYPAARKRSWSAMFRLSATLSEDIDPDILQSSLSEILPRFPSLSVRLRRGFFWYYLEQLRKAPLILQDSSYPCVRMSRSELRKCAFRVLHYKNRIAVEFFHAITDGAGGMVFLKTLTAEYLRQKYGVSIPSTEGVLSSSDPPAESEMEDSFFKYEGDIKHSRREETSYKLRGSREPDGFLHITTGILPLSEVMPMVKGYSVSLTTFLTAAMIAAIVNIQNSKIPNRRYQRPVKVQVPVNLRQFFESDTLRNFALYINPGVDPRLGDFSFEEILSAVHHKMGSELNDKTMKAKLTANVRSEKNLALKVMPLFLKNLALKTAYSMLGEKTSSVTVSNLGLVRLPAEMGGYVTRMDFILGALSKNPCSCGVISYEDKLYINIIRTIREPTLEHSFFTYLRKLGLPVKIESNQK